MTGEREWAAEHVVGVAQGVSEDILADLRANFEGECSEVGMYLAMSRVAHREGYPEIGLYWEKAAWEEAEHAAKFAELLGEVVTDSTKKNLEMRVEAENGATAGKFDLAKRAKLLTLMLFMIQFMNGKRRSSSRKSIRRIIKEILRIIIPILYNIERGQKVFWSFSFVFIWTGRFLQNWLFLH